MLRRLHETANAFSFRHRARRRQRRGRRFQLPGARGAASGALLLRRRVPPHDERPDRRPGQRRAGGRGADPRRRAAGAARCRDALLGLLGTRRGQMAPAARRPGARRLGRAPAPGAFPLIKRLLLLLMVLVPAGCERAAADRPATQLVAKVNGTEISVHQLRVGGAGTNPASAAQALEKVIDRELLVQKALAAKLDRDPQVQQSIENARRQLLAQAYLERTASAGAGKIGRA